MTRGTTLTTGVERGGVLGAGVIDVGRRCFVAGHVEANGAGDFGCDRPVVRLGEPDKVSVQLEGEA